MRRRFARPLTQQHPLGVLAFVFDLKVYVAGEDTWQVLTSGDLDVLKSWVKGGEDWRRIRLTNTVTGEAWTEEGQP